MALISFAVTAKLICVFVFAYAKIWFSHDVAQMVLSCNCCFGVLLPFNTMYVITLLLGKPLVISLSVVSIVQNPIVRRLNYMYWSLVHLSCVMRKPVFGFPTRSETNMAVQPQKMARGLKFQIWEEKGLYYP